MPGAGAGVPRMAECLCPWPAGFRTSAATSKGGAKGPAAGGRHLREAHTSVDPESDADAPLRRQRVFDPLHYRVLPRISALPFGKTCRLAGTCIIQTHTYLLYT